MTLRVGELIDPFAGGFIGGYGGPSRVEAIGADWVVVRDSNGEPRMADCSPRDLEEYRWKEEDD